MGTFDSVTFASQRQPPQDSHRSVRSMVRRRGVSKSTVQRRFDLLALQPHGRRHFKISNDAFFVEKVRDIVGLYLNPRPRRRALGR